MKRFAVLAFSLVLCLAFSGCSSNAAAALQDRMNGLERKVDDLSVQNETLSKESAELKETLESQAAPSPKPPPTPPKLDLSEGEYTYGDTIVTDDIEVTFGRVGDIEWSHIQNRFSDLDGEEVFALPVRIANTALDRHSLNVFFCSKFDPDGNRQPFIESYFEDDATAIGSMEPETYTDSLMHFLYTGDGEYRAVFDDLETRSIVRLPVTKPAE